MEYLSQTGTGEIALNPSYNMSNALAHGPSLNHKTFTWEDDFAKVVMVTKNEIPRPGIYLGRPCFHGNLRPYLYPDHNDDETIIFNSRMEYELIDTVRLRMPDDDQYNQFFRKIYQSDIVRVIQINKNPELNSLYPKARDQFGYSYMVIGKRKYRFFDNVKREFEKD